MDGSGRLSLSNRRHMQKLHKNSDCMYGPNKSVRDQPAECSNPVPVTTDPHPASQEGQENNENNQLENPFQLRRSTRIRKLPKRLEDYEM